MKKILFAATFFASLFTSVFAAAEYSDWAAPNQVSLVGSIGFRVIGSFGATYSCEIADQVFVSVNHPQYQEIYSMALSAFAAQKRIRFEVRKCGVIGWISSKEIPILDSTAAGEVATSIY
ncbi:MAG: hypothetical protein ACI9Y1_002405 [Lentisphaeria bacterium]|jgi:hypothetical protein